MFKSCSTVGQPRKLCKKVPNTWSSNTKCSIHEHSYHLWHNTFNILIHLQYTTLYKSVWSQGSADYCMSTATFIAYCCNIWNSATTFVAHTYVPYDAPLFAAQSCETGSATVSSCSNSPAEQTPHSNLQPRLSPNTNTLTSSTAAGLALKNWTGLHFVTPACDNADRCSIHHNVQFFIQNKTAILDVITLEYSLHKFRETQNDTN